MASKKFREIGTVAAVLLGASGVSWATSAVSQPTTTPIQACQGPNGQLRVVTTATDCRPSESALTWSVIGPVGPAGPQGPEGPVGPQGERGPPGPVDCPNSPNFGGSCPSAHVVGPVPPGSSQLFESALPAEGSGDAWFAFRIPWTSPEEFHPVVALAWGSPKYEVEVYTDCSGTAFTWRNAYQSPSGNFWEAGPIGNEGFNGWLYVRVHPTSVNPECVGYALEIANWGSS